MENKIKAESKKTKIFVLGAGFQKCGTSWAYEYLQNMSNFNAGAYKEYHVWDATDLNIAQSSIVKKVSILDRVKRSPKYIKFKMQNDAQFYFDYFQDLYNDSKNLTADITPAYSALSKKRFQFIKDEFEKRDIKVKVLVFMRDPVERIKSAVRFNLDRHCHTEGVSHDIKDFENAIEEYFKSEHCTSRTRYGETLENIYSVFDRDDVYCGIYESMFSSEEITRFSEFLNLPADTSYSKVVINKTSGTKLDLPELEEEIAQYYKSTYAYCSRYFPVTKELWRSSTVEN
uniref:sulfotransferase domain-containing protein n=1 Tax=Ningiella ruwaisensis TaxID=2364274 RepID=UPI00109F9656|nr:sulfotransferase domain-containing protein [Ningiella ruwaisensis]